MTKFYVALLSFGLMGFTASILTNDIISKLGVKHATAQDYIVANITGSFSSDFEISESRYFYPRIKDIHTLFSGDKAAAARELCEYMKAYVNSEEFLLAYQNKREQSKPQYEPQPVDPQALEAVRNNIKEFEQLLVEVRKSPQENAELITIYENLLTEQRATLAEYSDPTPNKTKWEKNYPADPAVLIRKKLQEHIDFVQTVDFSAKLTEPDKYNIQKFVNPEYESKPEHWKAIYRAGKEVNDAVVAFAKDWMKGELISGPKTRAVSDSQTASSSVQSTSSTNTVTTNTQEDAATPTEAASEAPKEKTSLLGKLKKAKSILKN